MNTKIKHIKQSAIFFLDIDGTLIRPNQKPNSSRLPLIIKYMKKDGAFFSLNSNRSLQDVVGIKKWLQLNGPIILENGAYSILGRKKILFAKSIRPICHVITKLTREFVLKNSLNCEVIVGDTVSYVKTGAFKKTPLIVLINKYRIYTGSVHIFRYGKHDFELAHKLAMYLRKAFIRLGLTMHAECSVTFGNTVVWPRDIDKGRALSRVKKMYKKHKIYMIGDSVSDLETLPFVDGFFAVNNAHPDVKKKSLYTSPYPYTKGVVDILRHYQKNINK